MFKVLSFFRVSQPMLRAIPKPFSLAHGQTRSFADTSNSDSKSIVAQGPENAERLRVRRARPGDAPRVLRFVRDHARTWPVPAPGNLALGDYVSRALAQGHSMLAEEPGQRGWSAVRGLALGAALCPWDAALLERWARCVRCPRSRSIMNFTAHCLRAPGLHHKYRVHKILQVTMIVPVDCPKCADIVQVLAENSIKRGHAAGFQLLRFDVTHDTVARTLESLQLKKEWQLSYHILPEAIKDADEARVRGSGNTENEGNRSTRNYIAVYTANLAETDEK